MKLQFCSGIILCGFLVTCAFAQQPVPVQNRVMRLDVVVTDKGGKPIAGLQQTDFTLLDNKRPQNLLSFRAMGGGAAEPAPQVILLIDEVNTTFTQVAYLRDQVERYLKSGGGELPQPVSFAVLNDKGIQISNGSSKDGNALITELNSNRNGLRTVTRSQGFYGAEDRLDLSLRGLRQLAENETARPGRKLVIWISPGWPLLSGPRIELTNKDQQGLFTNVVNLSYALRNAQITLYSIDPLGTADSGGLRTIYYQTFLKGVKKPSEVQIGNLGLQVLATQSGGLALNSSNDIAGEIARCVQDATAFYEVTFEGPRGDGPNEYHALEMKVDKPGLTARTRTGYYAQP